MKNKQIKVIAFDADDTLWDCQGHFEKVMQHLYDELTPWVDRETAAMELFATERKNMHLLGYGVKAFTLSMLETAMRVSRNEMPVAVINDILQRCYGLLQFPCTPLPQVEETLKALRKKASPLGERFGGMGWQESLPLGGRLEGAFPFRGRFGGGYTLAVFTKGELLDQEHKLERSGLAPYFDHVEITSDKGEKEFLDLCRKLNIRPDELMMVGNSLKSDIAPALAIGAQAVYIPFHVTWELEHHEDFEHERLKKIEQFSELLKYL